MNKTVAAMTNDDQTNSLTSQSADIKLSKDDGKKHAQDLFKQIKLRIITHNDVNSQSCPVLSSLFVYLCLDFVELHWQT